MKTEIISWFKYCFLLSTVESSQAEMMSGGTNEQDDMDMDTTGDDESTLHIEEGITPKTEQED